MKVNLQWRFESGAVTRYGHNSIAAGEDSLQFLFIMLRQIKSHYEVKRDR